MELPSDIFCRNCFELGGNQTVIVSKSTVQPFNLPSTLWENCADCIACEECFPYKSSGRINAEAGRVYWSQLYGLVTRNDLEPVVCDGGYCRVCGEKVADSDQLGDTEYLKFNGYQVYKHLAFLGDVKTGQNELGGFSTEGSVGLLLKECNFCHEINQVCN